MSGKTKKEPSLALGGQALIEGVMMRSKRHVVACVRTPSKEIITDIKPVKPFSDRNRVLGWPIIRGAVGMIESLIVGFNALMFSASNAFEIEGEEGKEPEKREFGWGEIAFIAEAVIRLAMFVGYLSAISLWGQYKRVLMYHGAEHKAIHASEAGVPMDVEHVKKFSRLHPRCGTSFLFIVLIISIVLFSVMPNLGFAINLAYRLLLIPVIAGISYELLRLSGKYIDSPVTKVLVAPGLAFQYLTTKEPTDDMLEVSIKAVLEVKKLICPTAQPAIDQPLS